MHSAHNPFSVSKMKYNSVTGTVIYHSKKTFGRNKKNFQILTPKEFIAAVTQHIPEKIFNLCDILAGILTERRENEAKQKSLRIWQKPGLILMKISHVGCFRL